MYRRFLKRCLSILGAVLALLLTGWIILLVWILLSIANKGAGAFFVQERPGKDGKPFKIIKFKTMTDERGSDGELRKDMYRITGIGKVVRSLSVDELPQLINILKGDMAFIGPRPLLMDYLPLYSREQMRRHEVRPGMSGWAQVNGRNVLSYTEQFEYDVYYVDHLSFRLDVKIFFMTVFKVFKRDGINEAGQATREPFDGTN
jgi:lipopolysaccharide/colanic/teichoic acid biosynthesis glycosyltransferase